VLNMKRGILIKSAIVTGLVICQSFSVQAMSMNSQSNELIPFESCEQATTQAQQAIQVDRQELKDYYKLKNLNPGQIPADQIRQAKFEALNLIRQYRDDAIQKEQDILNRCSVDDAEGTLEGLESAFDHLNIQLAMAHIHHYNSEAN